MSRQRSLARFLVSLENRVAFSAIQRLAGDLQNNRTFAANPLFLHGPAGSGKSHLAEALVREVTVTKLDLTAQITGAGDLRESTELPRDVDLLVVEDLQHLPPKVEETFVGLLDERRRRGQITVVTALMGPRHLGNKGSRFSARLTSRLAGGLVIALEPLQAPSRLALLCELAQRRQLAVSQDIMRWLAEHLVGGGRQLEGAIAQLETIGKLRRQPLDLKTVAAHFRPQVEAIRPTVERIATQVGGYFHVEPMQLQSRRRYRNILLPRQVGMYLARQLTRLSLGEIGSYFGGRDHTTVLHACRKVASVMKEDAVLSGAVRQIHLALA